MTPVEDIEDLTAKIKASTFTVVDFKAKWCKACTLLFPKLDALLSDLASSHGSSASIASFVVDVDAVPEVSDLYNVANLPTIVFFKEGELVGSYSGSDIDVIRSKVSDLIDGRLEATSSSDSGADATEPVYPPISADVASSDRCRVSLFIGDYVDSAHVSFSSVPDLGLDAFVLSADAQLPTNRVVQDSRSLGVDAASLSSETVHSMYEYRVPTISADGTCSNTEVLAKNPFNLAVNGYNICSASDFNASDLISHPMTDRLVRLKAIVEGLYDITRADWIGVYRLVSNVADKDTPIPTLMKESYRGEPSRALFPVTAEFAKRSTNSWVALNAKGRVISNTASIEEGVSYYKCSGSVLSELCVPILRRVRDESSSDPNSAPFEVIGIIDLESWNSNHFTTALILEVLKVAFDIGECNFLM